jgi:hypothetical protein
MVGPMTEHTYQSAMHDLGHHATAVRDRNEHVVAIGAFEGTAPSKTTASRRSIREFARIPAQY